MPRFSANLNFLFKESPFLDRFDAAARAGFRAVEFPDPYSWSRDELAARLERQGLACVLVNMPMGEPARGDRGLACLPDRRAEFRAGVGVAIETARALRCPRVNCMAGRRPEGVAAEALHATLVDNLRFAAREFARVGMTLCLEPLNGVENPDFYLTGSQQAAELIREVAHDNVKLQFDCYHMQLMQEDLAGGLARLLPLVGHIQFADAPGRHEPGTGCIDYPALFAHLDRLGYDGWVGAEYHPTGPTADTLSWLRWS